MTNQIDRLAIELQAVKTQLYRLGKKKDELNAQMMARHFPATGAKNRSSR